MQRVDLPIQQPPLWCCRYPGIPAAPAHWTSSFQGDHRTWSRKTKKEKGGGEKWVESIRRSWLIQHKTHFPLFAGNHERVQATCYNHCQVNYVCQQCSPYRHQCRLWDNLSMWLASVRTWGTLIQCPLSPLQGKWQHQLSRCRIYPGCSGKGRKDEELVLRLYACKSYWIWAFVWCLSNK